MPDRGVGVVAGRHRVPNVLVVVVVGLKLRIELVPAVRRNMPLIVADLTLGACGDFPPYFMSSCSLVEWIS
jgi:hypothetical protein